MMDVHAARAKLSALFPYSVVECYDGCSMATVKNGTLEQCKAYCRQHWNGPQNQGKSSLNILDRNTLRFVSFIL
jgi:hypothetical protein